MDALAEVGPTEALELVAEGATLLDVREQSEWRAGHAPAARHLPLAEVPDRVAELREATLVVCVCRSGARSRRATEFLREEGVAAVNLAGGMTAWAQIGLPLEGEGDAPHVA
jgi:rhodanese-related sulfurtransferase